MTEPALKGTLLLLQNRTRCDPESYREEFLAQLEHFLASSTTVASQRVANPQYIAVLNYLTHVSHCFPKESESVARTVLDLLRQSCDGGIPLELREALVKALILLRSKSLVSTDETFPIFFTLLQERNKTTRKLILSHIVSDIRKASLPGTKGGAMTHKRAQNYLFSVVEDDDPVQARCAELVMIDLYRRRIWCDERTVEVMTKACFSRHTTILRTALRFFLMQMPKGLSADYDNDSDEETQDPGRSISKLKQKLKIVKKTAKRDRVLKRTMKGIKRKYDKEEREEELHAKQHVDPIRLLRDPQQFVERLQSKLQKTSERFEVRILYLNVIARTISEHEVIHLPLYGFLVRYMEPSQLHSTQLLALSTMCVHTMIPPDAVEPLVKAIADHFVTDRSSADAITVGLNTIREICKRQPLAMSEDLLKDLAEYKNQRGDKGVMMASRALIQLYRDLYPRLLPAKLRGSKAGAPEDKERPIYGREHVYRDIPGLELLYQTATTSGCESDDGGASSGSGSHSSTEEDSDTGSDSGAWETDTDSELDPEDVEGDFVDVADSSCDEGDECPQLVSVGLGRDEGPKARHASPCNDEDSLRKKPRLDSQGENDSETSSLAIDNSDSDCDEEEVESTEESGSEDYKEEDSCCEDEDNEEVERPTLSAALVAASTEDWYEDINKDTRIRNRSESSRNMSSAGTTASISSNRILTDEDFKKIRRLQTQNGSHQSLHGKLKDRDARNKRRHDFIHGISADLSAVDIEHFTEKKRETDKQEKIERAQELRKASSKFEIQKKTKSKLNSTHGEHSKRGKLFQMTKRSRRVATKLKSSITDRAQRAKSMKKKDIKFRIKRGWKA
ncbi:unnamed protein product [Phytomonas sp. Hart1]|nr:unnamed protein product [Phytomonas sp. Hart1]|eukprot:CCW69675.1 unnamed protein product [Phytomonas sp. isolate Hart1]